MNNAMKLVKQIGLKEAKMLIDDAECFRMHLSGDDWDKPSLILCDDLKQIVEAFDLVQWHGGLKYAKSYFERNSKQHPDHYAGWDELQKAINLVEQCNV